eukprot:evm.model.NODE_48856_length_45577_cov_40.689011.1
MARDDDQWRALILAIWPSWAPLLQQIEEEGKRERERQEQRRHQRQRRWRYFELHFWRLFAARMRKASLPFTAEDAQEDEGEDEDEDEDEGEDEDEDEDEGEDEDEEEEGEEGKSDASSSVPVFIPSTCEASIPPPPPPPPPPSQLAASDVYIHFEVREEKGWWLPGREGQSPSPVLFSALLSLADPAAVRFSIYHPLHYLPGTLPGAVMEGGEGREGGEGGGRGRRGGALAMLLGDNLEDPHFSLVIDTAAIHLPTGRVVRLHE